MMMFLFFTGGMLLAIKHTNIINIIDEKTIPLFHSLVYNIIYAFSLCQIKYNQMYRALFLSPMREKEPIVDLDNNNKTKKQPLNVMFYNNSLLIKKIDGDFEKEEINTIVKNEEPLNYNLMIIYGFTNSSGRKTMINYTSNNNNESGLNLEQIYNYEESDYKFISINLIYNEKSYQIQLLTEYCNFYIVNNIIDNIFLHYYLTDMLKIQTENIKQFSYKLEIMDHNINMFTLNETQFIVFKKNDYNVCSIDTMREKEPEDDKVEDANTEDANANTEYANTEYANAKGETGNIYELDHIFRY